MNYTTIRLSSGLLSAAVGLVMLTSIGAFAQNDPNDTDYWMKSKRGESKSPSQTALAAPLAAAASATGTVGMITIEWAEWGGRDIDVCGYWLDRPDVKVGWSWGSGSLISEFRSWWYGDNTGPGPEYIQVELDPMLILQGVYTKQYRVHCNHYGASGTPPQVRVSASWQGKTVVRQFTPSTRTGTKANTTDPFVTFDFTLDDVSIMPEIENITYTAPLMTKGVTDLKNTFLVVFKDYDKERYTIKSVKVVPVNTHLSLPPASVNLADSKFDVKFPNGEHGEYTFNVTYEYEDKLAVLALEKVRTGRFTKSDIKVYFNRDENDTLGATAAIKASPNWFKYWRSGKDGACPSLTDEIKYDASFKASAADGWHFGENDGISIRLGKAVVTVPFARTYNLANRTNSEDKVTIERPIGGISLVEETIKHELMHGVLRTENGGLSHTFVYGTNNPAGDRDGDGLFNATYETGAKDEVDGKGNHYTVHFNPSDKDTYNLASNRNSVYAFYGDNELICMIRSSMSLGEPTKDWARVPAPAAPAPAKWSASEMTSGEDWSHSGRLVMEDYLLVALTNLTSQLALNMPTVQSRVVTNQTNAAKLDGLGFRVRFNGVPLPPLDVNLLGYLVAADGVPFAWATASATVAADGSVDAELLFDGKLIYENHVNGSYQLRYLNMKMVEHTGPPLYAQTNLCTTPIAYQYSDFIGGQGGILNGFSDARVGNQLQIGMDIEVAEAGDWELELALGSESDDVFVASAVVTNQLSAGAHRVVVPVNGNDIFKSKINGPYTLRYVYLKKGGVLVDQMRVVYKTAPYGYLDFAPAGTALLIDAGSFRWERPRLGGSGYYTGLVGSFSVRNQSAAGDFLIYSTLAGANNAIVASVPQYVNLPAGESLVSVRFAGNVIAAAMVDGPYRLFHSAISPLEGASGEDSFTCGVLSPAYQANEFSSYVGEQDRPANDNFYNATVLDGMSGSLRDSTVGATRESGEPNHGGATGGASIWWSWTAPSNAVVAFDTDGSSFDTALAVYQGSYVGGLTCLDRNDNVVGGLQSYVQFEAVEGETYYIAVDRGGADSGDVVLNWGLAKGVNFAVADVRVSESVGKASVRVINSDTNVSLCSVSYWMVWGTASAADAAMPKTQPLQVSWTNQAGSKTIQVPILTDKVVEGDETLYVLLGNPKNCSLGRSRVCKVTIMDASSGVTVPGAVGKTLPDALDNVLLKWTTGGTPAWVPQSAVTYDGVDAAASGAMASNKASFVQTSVTGTGTLSFAWSVSGKGVLRLLDGAKPLAAVTNDTWWQTRTITLTNNAAHVLKWEFTQGGSTNARAYLDRVVWVPGGKWGVTVSAVANNALGGTVSGTGVYYAGAKVPLSAAPNPGWYFAGWTPTYLFAKPLLTAQTLTVSNSSLSAVANFAKVPVVIGLPNPPEGGTVTGSGSCLPGKSVTLKASPAATWAFTSWSDGSQAASRTVSASSDVTLYAGFKPVAQIAAPVISVSGSPQAMVGVFFSLPLGIQSESLPTVAVAGLPAGLAYVAETKTIAGVPTAAASNKVVTVTAKNVNKAPGTNTFTMTVAPLAAGAQGTFTGFALEDGDAGDTVRGLLTATVTPLGAVSAKVSAQAGAVSFTGKSWDSASGGVFRATLRTAKGETLALTQDPAVPWATAGLGGTLVGGVLGSETLQIQGQRNAAFVKTAADYAAATNALVRYKGYYTVALPPEGELEYPGAAGNVPQGNGWLALTVKDGGAVALAGKLADGTPLSGASTLLLLNAGTPDEAAYVPFLFPLYGAKGGFSGMFEILPGSSAAGNVAVCPEEFLLGWRYPGKTPASVPPQTEDRFALALGASGGYYNTLADLRAHYSNAWFAAQWPNVFNTYGSGAYTVTVGVVEAALPEESLRFDAKTGAVSLPVGKAPVYSAAASNYVYAVTNPAVATLTVTKATGLFAGKFNLYFEYRDQKGALQLKTAPVSHEGALTPVRAEPEIMPPGLGFYLVPDTWKTPGAKPVAYPLKRSYGVEIQDGAGVE